MWSAVAAEAAGAANEGVRNDPEAVRHLRGAFQQRANISAIQQAQHASLRGSMWDGSTPQHGGEDQGVQASQKRSSRRPQRSNATAHGADARNTLNDELAGSIPGDGTGFRMSDPALIVFASQRPAELQQALAALCALEGLGRFVLYVSQAGGNDAVRAVVSNAALRLQQRARNFERWVYKRRHQQASRSQHYRFGLYRAFQQRRHSHVIVLDDDMQASPDLLLYFEAMAPLLEVDPTLWCISAWNDNSRAAGFRWDAKRMMRTSYFPGQGWLLRRQLWDEIGSTWPHNDFDTWMRLPDISHGRDCIAPEVNRIQMIDSAGPHQQNMTWHTEMMHDWGDLSYLIKGNYEAGFRQLMQHALPVPADRLNPQQPGFLEVPAGHVYLLTYRSEEYAEIAQALHIPLHPCAHFQHAVLLPYRGSFILLADARACPLLPESWRVLPSPALLAVAGPRGQSCTAVCRRRGQECSAEDFWFLNSCKELRQHFACEMGCITGNKLETPSYMADELLPNFHQCLVTGAISARDYMVALGTPSCVAQHQGALRLCPCVPRNTGAATGTLLAGSNAAMIQPKDDQLQMGLVAA